ncbi:Vegetative incompatibility protein HET-E-1 [Diplonema papillatum]|nr:Vegetative incompatibility protein HET-E-1 [Diplonema papillatum]
MLMTSDEDDKPGFSLEAGMWHIPLVKKKQINLLVRQDNIEDELWIGARRQFLDGQLDEVRKEARVLTTAKLISLISNDRLADVRKAMDEAVDLDEFVDTITTAILEGDSRAHTEESLRDCARALFFLIDINSNGVIDWTELSHYIVHSHDSSREAALSHQPWAETSRACLPAERCRKRRVFLFPQCSKLVTLDTCPVGLWHQGVMSVHSTRDVKTDGATDVVLEPFATVKNESTFEAAAWHPLLEQLVVSTANNQLRWYAFEDEKDEAPEPVRLVKYCYVDGMQLKLCYDKDTKLLFCGNNKGEIFGIKPDNSPHIMPTIAFTAKPHKQHPIVDLLPLPGMKVVSCGLDSKCLINDLSTCTVERELVRNGENSLVTSLTYSREYSLLATGGYYDPEPSIWTPLAGQFISKLRDLDAPHRGRMVRVLCVDPEEPYTSNFRPWHLLSADSSGMVKVWDLRKVTVLQTFWLDPLVGDLKARFGGPDSFLKKEEDPLKKHRGLNLYDFAVDTGRGCMFSSCRTETERATLVHRQTLKKHRNGSIAHDSAVSHFLYNMSAGCYLTVSKMSVRVWDAATGVSRSTFSDITASPITTVSFDTHGRRFLLGCHNGSITAHALATGGLAGSCKPTLGEVTGIAELSDMGLIVVSSCKNVIVYKEKEDPLQPADPITILKLPTVQLCLVVSRELNVFAVGDAKDGITVYDATTAFIRIKAVATLAYEGITVKEEEATVGEPTANQATERQIRSYLHSKSTEISSLTVCYPYPVLVSGDYSGYLTAWTLRPHRRPYHCCGRWKMARCHQSAASPVATGGVALGETLYLCDDSGCLSIWNMRPVYESQAIAPVTSGGAAGPSPGTRPQRASDTAQAILLCVIPAHEKMLPVTAVVLIPRVNLVATSGSDRNIYFWTSTGEYVGRLQQGKQGIAQDASEQQNEFNDYTPVADRLQEQLLGAPHKAGPGGNGESTPAKDGKPPLNAPDAAAPKDGGPPVDGAENDAAAAQPASPAAPADGPPDEGLFDPGSAVTRRVNGFVLLPAAQYNRFAGSLREGGRWKPSGDLRQGSPVTDEEGLAPAAADPTPTPPPSPVGKRHRNKFPTGGAGPASCVANAKRFDRRTEHHAPERTTGWQTQSTERASPVRGDDTPFAPNACVAGAAGKLAQAVPGDAVAAFAASVGGQPVALVCLRAKLPIFDVPCVSVSLRSVPSSQLDWKHLVPPRRPAPWTHAAVAGFLPFQTTAPETCTWVSSLFLSPPSSPLRPAAPPDHESGAPDGAGVWFVPQPQKRNVSFCEMPVPARGSARWEVECLAPRLSPRSARKGGGLCLFMPEEEPDNQARSDGGSAGDKSSAASETSLAGGSEDNGSPAGSEKSAKSVFERNASHVMADVLLPKRTRSRATREDSGASLTSPVRQPVDKKGCPRLSFTSSPDAAHPAAAVPSPRNPAGSVPSSPFRNSIREAVFDGNMQHLLESNNTASLLKAAAVLEINLTAGDTQAPRDPRSPAKKALAAVGWGVGRSRVSSLSAGPAESPGGREPAPHARLCSADAARPGGGQSAKARLACLRNFVSVAQRDKRAHALADGSLWHWDLSAAVSREAPAKEMLDGFTRAAKEGAARRQSTDFHAPGRVAIPPRASHLAAATSGPLFAHAKGRAARCELPAGPEAQRAAVGAKVSQLVESASAILVARAVDAKDNQPANSASGPIPIARAVDTKDNQPAESASEPIPAARAVDAKDNQPADGPIPAARAVDAKDNQPAESASEPIPAARAVDAKDNQPANSASGPIPIARAVDTKDNQPAESASEPIPAARAVDAKDNQPADSASGQIPAELVDEGHQEPDRLGAEMKAREANTPTEEASEGPLRPPASKSAEQRSTAGQEAGAAEPAEGDPSAPAVAARPAPSPTVAGCPPRMPPAAAPSLLFSPCLLDAPPPLPYFCVILSAAVAAAAAIPEILLDYPAFAPAPFPLAPVARLRPNEYLHCPPPVSKLNPAHTCLDAKLRKLAPFLGRPLRESATLRKKTTDYIEARSARDDLAPVLENGETHRFWRWEAEAAKRKAKRSPGELADLERSVASFGGQPLAVRERGLLDRLARGSAGPELSRGFFQRLLRVHLCRAGLAQAQKPPASAADSVVVYRPLVVVRGRQHRGPANSRPVTAPLSITSTRRNSCDPSESSPRASRFLPAVPACDSVDST